MSLITRIDIYSELYRHGYQLTGCGAGVKVVRKIGDMQKGIVYVFRQEEAPPRVA
jgi:hypothetical protein